MNAATVQQTGIVDKRAHTPGPWREYAPEIDGVVDDTYRIILSGQGYFAPSDGPGWSISGFIPPEDAQLIAAAPDLLAVAKQYASECGECNGTGQVVVGVEQMAHGELGVETLPITAPCEDCAFIRDAIAKAEVR